MNDRIGVPPLPHHALVREATLSPFAVLASKTRGRQISQPPCPMRSPYQRDRDRIVHASAFRRLTYKTQVFVYHEGDHYRTRMTHSLEVAQIARAMARLLLVDEDLAEAIALAHDLGHTPFGHAGERALNAAMAPFGGFDHNAQSLKVVTAIENRYAGFAGLNLSWETLEGLVKHNGPLGADTTPQAITAFDEVYPLDLATFASLEAQLAAVADDIAYNNHDVDDALRAGLITIDEVRCVPLVGALVDQVESAHRDLSHDKLIYEVNRRLITRMIDDVVAQTRRRLAKLEPASANDIRNAGRLTATFSGPMARDLEALRRFLFERVYRHPRIVLFLRGAERIVSDLFARYLDVPEDLVGPWKSAAASLKGRDERAHLINDFVAGMTDRFAVSEHRRLFDDTPQLR